MNKDPLTELKYKEESMQEVEAGTAELQKQSEHAGMGLGKTKPIWSLIW